MPHLQAPFSAACLLLGILPVIQQLNRSPRRRKAAHLELSGAIACTNSLSCLPHCPSFTLQRLPCLCRFNCCCCTTIRRRHQAKQRSPGASACPPWRYCALVGPPGALDDCGVMHGGARGRPRPRRWCRGSPSAEPWVRRMPRFIAPLLLAPPPPVFLRRAEQPSPCKDCCHGVRC